MYLGSNRDTVPARTLLEPFHFSTIFAVPQGQSCSAERVCIAKYKGTTPIASAINHKTNTEKGNLYQENQVQKCKRSPSTQPEYCFPLNTPISLGVKEIEMVPVQLMMQSLWNLLRHFIHRRI